MSNNTGGWTELTLEEILEDPMTTAIMSADGVDAHTLRTLLIGAAGSEGGNSAKGASRAAAVEAAGASPW